MYHYYCIMRPAAPGTVPRPSEVVNFKHFSERRYVAEIDRMAWGWVEYETPLTPMEISEYELISEPREDEDDGDMG